MNVRFGFGADQIVRESRVTADEIQSIRAWLDTRKLPKLTQEQIAIFLLSNNEIKATESCIKRFYSIRFAHPRIFNNRKIDRKDLKDQIKVVNVCLLPERTDDGCSIIFARISDPKPSHMKTELFMMNLFMVLDAALYDYPPAGLIVLFDVKGLELKHLSNLRLGLMKILFQYLQEAVPIRLRKIHLLNTVSIINKLVLVIKPFVKKELWNLISFHESNVNLESIRRDHLPKRCLPEELGGDLPAIDVLLEKTLEKLREMDEHFDAEELQRTSFLK